MGSKMHAAAKNFQVSTNALHLVSSIYQAKHDTPKNIYKLILKSECAAEFKDKDITDEDVSYMVAHVCNNQYGRDDWSVGRSPKYSLSSLKNIGKKIKAASAVASWVNTAKEEQGEAETSEATSSKASAPISKSPLDREPMGNIYPSIQGRPF